MGRGDSSSLLAEGSTENIGRFGNGDLTGVPYDRKDKESLLAKIKTLDHNIEPAAFAVSYFEGSDGTEIPAISYTIDYRAEEEYGARNIIKALTGEKTENTKMTKNAKNKIAFFKDCDAVVFSTESILNKGNLYWDDNLKFEEEGSRYPREFSSERYIPSDNRKEFVRRDHNAPNVRSKMKEIKEYAERHGFTGPYSRKKAELLEQLDEHMKKNPINLDYSPGFFKNGKNMILRAEEGTVSADMIKNLKDAYEAGTLGVVSGRKFLRSGLMFYDTRHESKQMKKDRKAKAKRLAKDKKKSERMGV